MNEIFSWILALCSLGMHFFILKRLLRAKSTASGRASVWFALLAIAILPLWYLLKATELGIDHRWALSWGIARRMNDPSHWIVAFVALLMIAAYPATFTLGATLPGFAKRVGEYAFIGIGLGYLLLVRIADCGQTFFFPSGYGTTVKWLQIVEGATSITAIMLGVIATLYWLTVYSEDLQQARGERALPRAFWVPGTLVAMTIGFWALMSKVRLVVLYTASDLPETLREGDGPNTDTLVLQVLGSAAVFVLAMLVAWKLVQRSGR